MPEKRGKQNVTGSVSQTLKLVIEVTVTLPRYMGSHTPFSEYLSPFLEGAGGCCYAKNASWPKIVPTQLCSA